MVIAKILVLLRNSGRLPIGPIVAIHIDYANREESSKEADFVRKVGEGFTMDLSGSTLPVYCLTTDLLRTDKRPTACYTPLGTRTVQSHCMPLKLKINDPSLLLICRIVYILFLYATDSGVLRWVWSSIIIAYLPYRIYIVSVCN